MAKKIAKTCVSHMLKKIIPCILLIVFALSFWFFELHTFFKFETFRVYQYPITLYVAQHRLYAGSIFCLIYIAIVALSLPVAAFLSSMAGVLFGHITGTCLVVISATIGSAFLFLMARYALHDFFSPKAAYWLQKMDKNFKANAFFYLLSLRLVPLVPFFAVNLVCAFLPISFVSFCGATFLGVIPGAWVYVGIGALAQSLLERPEFTFYSVLTPQVVGVLVALALLSITPVIYRYISTARNLE